MHPCLFSSDSVRYSARTMPAPGGEVDKSRLLPRILVVDD